MMKRNKNHDPNGDHEKSYVHFTDKDLTLFNFCINHTPIIPAPKTVKAHVCSATNPMTLPKKLKMAPTTLATIASNVSTAFPASL